MAQVAALDATVTKTERIRSRSPRRPALWPGVAIAAVVWSCAGSDRGFADPAARPLILAYAGELQTLNPLVSTDQNANELIYTLLFTPLVTYDAEFRVRPWLASSWTLDETGVEFTLRTDVTWHDGTPVTVEDVKFTFDMAKEPVVASPLGAAYLSRVGSAEVVGPDRIRFMFTEPHAEPLEDFFWPPVPRHLLEGVPPADLVRHEFGRMPVGSGPYRLVAWTVGEGLELEARAGFPEALGGRPGFARVLYRIIPEPTTRLARLRRGEIHVDGPISPEDAERVEDDPEIAVLSFPWRQFTYVGWNTLRDPFRDADARRALAMAIDRDQLLEAIMRGRGRPGSSVIPPWHPYATGLEPLPFAPDSAAAILDGLGWTDADGDGVRERNGHRLEFELLAGNRNPVLGDLAQVIQAQLARVGISVTPRLLEWQTVLGMHRARDFDAVLTNWVLDNFRIDPRPLFHSSQARVERSANRSSYRSAAADSLMDLGVRTLDPDTAARIWRSFAEVLQRDQPITILFWNDELVAVRAEIQGVAMDARGELATLPNWHWSDGPPPE
jgi:peptide/nickel transport system substrate-binding protein